MTRRKLCVVCWERPTDGRGAVLCKACDKSCRPSVVRAARRARMCERRRWTGLLKQGIMECDAAASRTNWDDTTVASKMECAARASMLRAILMTGTKARKR
jgi:hypothetical protein